MQTVVRSVSVGETLVNGAPVSVAALRHKDEVIIGGRTLRWEYNEPNRPRPLAPQPGMNIIIIDFNQQYTECFSLHHFK